MSRRVNPGWSSARRGAPRRVALALLLAVGITSAVPWPAAAQDGRATVRLDGRAVLRVGGGPDESPAERARAIERRLSSLLQTEPELPPVRIEPGKDATSRVVTLLGIPVVTVREGDAEDARTTVDALAAQWAREIDAALVDSQARRRTSWSRFGTEVAGAISAAFAGVAESGIVIVPRVLASILVLLAFWAVASAVRWLMRQIFRYVVDDLTVENLVRQIAYYAVWAVGLVVAVDALGVDRGSLATGLGLTGLALGFALKDILSNFVSGLLLLALRPFRVGDQIIVGETEGTVERVELRATQVRTYDGRAVLVPNADVFTSRVTNNTGSPVRRASVTVHLSYPVDLRAAAALFGAAARRTSGVLPDPAPTVLVPELGPEAVQLEVRFWTDSRRADFVETASEVRQAIVAAAKRAGIALPEPEVRRVVLAGGEGRDEAGAADREPRGENPSRAGW